ncbi:AGE family epimerase/isomerase, partial [Microbacterium sp.]|uniref:AGE family epimerase/isomerase n=1 Tax=Microbacterium sp. TaxID=51671 RepID=UPI00260F0A7C
MRWGSAGEPGALVDSDAHRAELTAETARLLAFFEEPSGIDRFRWRRVDGSVDVDQPLALYNVGRLVHCFAIAQLLGHPQTGGWAEDGVRVLLDRFVESESLGFVDAVDIDQATVVSDARTTYGHAFALLAGTTARQAGIAGSDEVVRRAVEAIDAWLWHDDVGAAVDAVDRHGRVLEAYRGQNANMHLTEAFTAAYEDDRDPKWLRRAERLAQRLVVDTVVPHDARIPEHYGPDWVIDPDYGRETPFDQFRPFGTMPGHAVEWARLLLNIGAYSEVMHAPLLTCAKALFAGALRDGREDGIAGLAYTVDYDGNVVSHARMHWVAAEALGAAAWLARATGEPEYAEYYSDFWHDITTYFADHRSGSWWHELD